MFKRPARFSYQLHQVSLLLGVYALHLFLFLGLTVFSNASLAGESTFRVPAGSSHASHDPASVECRSLFKYDDSKQQVQVADFPLVAQFITNLYSFPSIEKAGVKSVPSIELSDVSIRRYCLFGVFLI